jgi:hypothetical protein
VIGITPLAWPTDEQGADRLPPSTCAPDLYSRWHPHQSPLLQRISPPRGATNFCIPVFNVHDTPIVCSIIRTESKRSQAVIHELSGIRQICPNSLFCDFGSQGCRFEPCIERPRGGTRQARLAARTPGRCRRPCLSATKNDQRSGRLRIARQISRRNRCQRSRTANVIDDVFNRADVTNPKSDRQKIAELDS